ncbi:hypothetical protein DSO57_1013259 [Entomophthora muscae]|uniref:Uncharacterized protein n=1 Tax=Entomophthora muscae TaxID=34485 RepID=A0ACC2T5P2_9FUNG|nr:hypothetical protein DSO57_1013259 [Entomophthora muscae]
MENETYLGNQPTHGYSAAQVTRYLQYIGFLKTPTLTYEDLAKLVLKHTETFPYGNLSYVYYHQTQHPAEYPTDPLDPYSTKGSSLHPQAIYRKFMDEKRDGSCFEHGVFLANILGQLGFRHYGVGGKTVINFAFDSNKSQAVMTEIRHYVLVVLLGNEKFLVDVGFGRFGIFAPLQLPSEESLVGPRVPIPGGVQLQIVRQHPMGAIDLTLPFPPLYLVRARVPKCHFTKNKTGEVGWMPLYFFTNAPLFPRDIETIHFAVTHNTAIKYNQLILLRKRITSPTPGVLMLRDDQLKFYADDGSITHSILNTEAKRRNAILHLFGVHLPAKDQEHLPTSNNQLRTRL